MADTFTAEALARAEALVDRINPMLHGNEPEVVGAALAMLLGTLIAGHHPDLRYVQLDLIIETVRKVVPIEVEGMIARGLLSPDWRDPATPRKPH